VAGYGAKAAYRGDKLTRRVWGDILVGDFVAQALVPPAGRKTLVDGVLTDLKFDIRAYTYAWTGASCWRRGCTPARPPTFRTQGGGFAPVIVVPEEGANLMCGICGELRFDGRSPDMAAIGRMSDQLGAPRPRPCWHLQ
jgi:hypothetical protein